MSQSPLDASGRTNTDRYIQGWKALNRLLHEDRSFSGRERHCVYLNCGAGPFADMSAVSGLNYADDGRAVVATDWDFDGDVDLWFANRTAPRLRFMRNDGERSGRFLAIRLRGDGKTTNRDAIGARVELELAGDPPVRLVRTLRAGDAFLSQSSKWLHFGLGTHERAERVTVHWPGASARTYPALRADHRYVIDQAGGEPTVWTPPTVAAALAASTPRLPDESDAARIVLQDGVPLPPLAYQDWDGSPRALTETPLTGPTLINLWASWCGPCIVELSEWTKHAEALRERGLSVVALSTDGMGGGGTKPADGRAALKRMGFAFRSGRATEQTLAQLDALQKATLDRWRPLPLPSSVLADRYGRAIVIYRGPVSADQLLADLDLLDVTPQQRLASGLPLPGRWLNRPGGVNPMLVVSQLVDAARVNDAIAYLGRYVEVAAAAGDASPTKLADAHYLAGVLLQERQREADAVRAFRAAAQANPDDFRVRRDLGELLWKSRDMAGAAEQFAHAVRINPKEAGVRRRLAMIRLSQDRHRDAAQLLEPLVAQRPGDPTLKVDLAGAYLGAAEAGRAMDLYRQALKLAPGMPKAANNLAWLLATHPDPSLRDGEEAVRLAEALCKSTQYKQPLALDTLAAAYAQAGRFEDAVRTLRLAIELLHTAKRTSLIADFEARLQLYEQGRPFLDKPDQ